MVIEFLPRFLHPVGPKTQDSSIEVVVAGGVDRRTGNPTTNPVTKGSSRCSRRSPVGRLRGGVDIVGNHLCPEGLVTPLTTMKCFFFSNSQFLTRLRPVWSLIKLLPKHIRVRFILKLPLQHFLLSALYSFDLKVLDRCYHRMFGQRYQKICGFRRKSQEVCCDDKALLVDHSRSSFDAVQLILKT